MVDYDELKHLISQARMGLDMGGLEPVQEVSAALFFTLGLYLIDINDRLAKLEPPTNQSILLP